MKKYWIFPQISGVAIWKLNKANNAFLDKEYLNDSEVIGVIALLVNHIKRNHTWDIAVTSNWVEEFSIVFPKKDG